MTTNSMLLVPEQVSTPLHPVNTRQIPGDRRCEWIVDNVAGIVPPTNPLSFHLGWSNFVQHNYNLLKSLEAVLNWNSVSGATVTL